MLVRNSYDTIANRTHDFPACSAVPQPTAPPSLSNIYHFFQGMEEVNTIKTRKYLAPSRSTAHGNDIRRGEILSLFEQTAVGPLYSGHVNSELLGSLLIMYADPRSD
jgi:hypothetical protein